MLKKLLKVLGQRFDSSPYGQSPVWLVLDGDPETDSVVQWRTTDEAKKNRPILERVERFQMMRGWRGIQEVVGFSSVR